MLSRIFLIVSLLASATLAQGLGISVAVNPAGQIPVGQTVNFTISVPITQPTATLASGCSIVSIRSAPNGPIVWQPFICPFILINIAPGSSYPGSWDQKDSSNQQVAPGVYWAQIAYSSSATGGNIVSQWFCFEIVQNPPSPVLASSGPLQAGQLTGFSINAPAHPSHLFLVLASLTSNNPITIGNELTCLDNDIVLNEILAGGSPGTFLGFAGFLSNSGTTNTPAIQMPNLPALELLPFHVQAVIIDLATFPNVQTKLTNGLNFSILP